MATKNDLIEAQTFSRRRLLTAFVSGAPGGKELEPKAPLRAVIAAIALTVAVVLVGVFWGLIKPGLPNGWDNGTLIVVTDTGARFVTIEGFLHPVVNTASARLLLPSSGFSVIATDQSNLSGVSLGDTLGIVGAPDELPAPSALQNSDWSACVTDEADIDLRLGGSSAVETDGKAVVVESDGDRYVVDGEKSYAVADKDSDAILRAAGVTALNPVEVSVEWLNLFTPGTELAPVTVDGAGKSVAGTDLLVGDVISVEGADESERYLVQSSTSLAVLTPIAWQLYQLASGASSEVTTVAASEVSGLETAARPVGGEDWPAGGFESIEADQRPCALLQSDSSGVRTVLATQPASDAVEAGVSVEPGAGALVQAGGRGEQSTGILTLIDATGTSFALPGATEETVNRLGYDIDDIGDAGDVWVDLFTQGPALTEAAAGISPSVVASDE
ncbi:type VII secretion protein EccB [Microbacterium halimionae]|uniref:Type VII secretion protein EccB n=1 Tax=Microbacterium halimionae TaxID=1526413 RepID=A0A7W3PKJ7_9MICO|nr:type VII secretion protein EccB [Microbacterium halimionae]MBA8815036.1 type VII secretion protein EccB [Microbacterium halimionae]NII94173.1 type VII secretion protein EccB [Microbacterium halimionae]